MNVNNTKSEFQQLSLKDLFWIVTAVAALLAYARSWGELGIHQALVYVALVVVLGGLIGAAAKQFFEGLFWSALTSLIAYVAVAGGNLPSYGVLMGWGTVGAACGALAGVRVPRQMVPGALASAAVALLSMSVTVLCVGESLSGLILFDLACAGLIGLIIRPFLSFLQNLEDKTSQPRVVLASWLTLVFLLGNYLVPIVGGVPR